VAWALSVLYQSVPFVQLSVDFDMDGYLHEAIGTLAEFHEEDKEKDIGKPVLDFASHPGIRNTVE
jgi:hypothetical protein